MSDLTHTERAELSGLVQFCTLRNGVGETYQYVLVRSELLLKLAELAAKGSLVRPENETTNGAV